MRCSMLTVVCLSAAFLAPSAIADVKQEAVKATAAENSEITQGTSRQRVFAMLGQPWIVDRTNDRWIYPTQTIMFKNDQVTGILDSDPSRFTSASNDSKATKSAPKAKKGRSAKRVAKPQTARRKAPARKAANRGPFAAVKKTYYRNPTLPDGMMRSSNRRSNRSFISPYQSNRYGHNLTFRRTVRRYGR